MYELFGLQLHVQEIKAVVKKDSASFDEFRDT